MSGFGKGIENRQFGRRLTHLHGWVTVPGRPRLSCTVRDLTVRGALLSFEQASPVELPFSFKLMIEAAKFETHCECRHQRGNRIGVEFIQIAEAPTTERRTADDAVEAWTGRN